METNFFFVPYVISILILQLVYIYIVGLIKFLVPINIHSFVFSPNKIKSHFLVPVTFSLSILGTKNVDGKIL